MEPRRLPIYLLLDCSESMAGPAIEAVTQGVQSLSREVKTNPLALETAYLSVITFSREAQQVVPLTEALFFQPPPLRIRPGTALGAALRLLQQCIEKEVRKTTPTQKGDYKPLVFLLTDGQPTDDWRPAVAALQQLQPRPAYIYAIGCGPDADLEVLYSLSDRVLLMSDLTPQAFQKLFVWLSASVQAASAGIGQGVNLDKPSLPPLPAGLLQELGEAPHARDGQPYQLFLHARCSQNRRPYLMRFQREQHSDQYEPVAAHVMEEMGEEEQTAMPPVSSQQLLGVPACPHCGSPGVGLCPCGTMFCLSDEPQEAINCPGCRATLSLSEGGDLALRQSQG